MKTKTLVVILIICLGNFLLAQQGKYDRKSISSLGLIWHEDELVAGLYGIMQNGIFCGESMFHQVSNGSKLAMWPLLMSLAIWRSLIGPRM